MSRRVLIADRRVAAALGVGALGVGWLLLHDAYVRRGVKAPLPLRPFIWWQ